jgi:hypothetical protein
MPNTTASLKTWSILILFVLILMAIESVMVYQIYATRFPGTADFFARWYGARELVLRGRNPYDRKIEMEAQEAMFGRQTRPDEDQVNFAYPLYTIFLFWPLTLTSYAWAQAIWMVVLQFALIGQSLLLFGLTRWRPPPWLFVITIFWSLFFYSGARAIFLGQFSVLVALSVVTAAWGLLNDKDKLAGAILPLATVKPQMAFLVIPFFLLWALGLKRWSFLIAFVVSAGILFLGSLFWVPDWPLRFLGNLSSYSDYVGFGSPLENMTARFAPGIDHLLNLLLTVMLLVLLLWQWWLALTKGPETFLWGLTWTLLVGNLIAFRSATANHVILYLPLFLLFKRLTPANWKIALVQVISTVALWVIFLTTIDQSRGHNFEAIFMHGLLPSLLIIYFLLDWRALKATTPKMKV